MNRYSLFCGLSVLVLSVLFMISGCGGDGRPPTYPTKGKILIKGKGYSDVVVLFHPVGGKKDDVPLPRGATSEDGTFEITTFKKGDGAPAGEYNVTIMYESVSSPLNRNKKRPPAFPTTFTQPNSTPLKATIEAKEMNSLPEFKVP